MITYPAMDVSSAHCSAVPMNPVNKDPPTISRPSAPSLRAMEPSSPSSSEKPSSASSSHFFEPAADGPSSPERICQLNKQMKRVSRLQRRHGHRAASSDTSSLASLAGSDRHEWELQLDSLYLARHSSIQSSESSAPPRNRPDSVHTFGRNLFHRRGKPKRDSGSHSSPTSSVYSSDVPVDNAATSPKDFFIPAIFSRRKPSRNHVALKKLQISGPFNFKHVAHKRREHQPAHIQPSNRLEATQDLSAICATGPASPPGARISMASRGLHSFDSSSGPMNQQHHGMYHAIVPRPPLYPRHTGPGPDPRRLMKHVQLWDRYSTNPSRAPIRPPQSPTQARTSSPFPHTHPPRISSRRSNHQGVYGVVASTRPQTSGGLGRPQPFGPCASTGHLLPSTGHHDQMLVPWDGASPALGGTRDVPWPLASPDAASYETALPDVPEEEEHYGPCRRSRLSLASNDSSLRGSQSVPTLRSKVETQRPMSGTSETLGRFELVAAHHMGNVEAEAKTEPEMTVFGGCWEDDIDYCYEHEAEANCNYEWERPSLEIARAEDTLPILVALANKGLTETEPHRLARASPAVLSPVSLCPPILSPSSQASMDTGHEAATPTHGLAVANNFSLPQGEGRSFRSLDLTNSRCTSSASSFRESQEFKLSPSLLIPGDYQRQIFLEDTEKRKFPEYEESAGLCHQKMFYEDNATLLSDKSMESHQRSSTSTTTTNSTSRSNSTEKRHMSRASSWTTFTRHTASSTSLNKVAGTCADEAESLHKTNLADQILVDSEPGLSSASSRQVVTELAPFPPTLKVGLSSHRSHVSVSLDHNTVAAPKSHDVSRPRGQRAKTTTSLNAQALPPAVQYVLFPRACDKNTGDQV